MKIETIRQNQLYKSALGAVLVTLCGLSLWRIPAGESWLNASYDYLFRVGGHKVTNEVVLILMDDAAYDYFHQERGKPWDRALHAQLLHRLADDGCALVALDSFFRLPREPAKDNALADAMRRQRHVVLMAEQAQVTHPDFVGARPTLPSEPFLSATRTNWGVAWLDPDLDLVVRRHWPFPAPGPYPSLPWTAARLAGAQLTEKPQEQWLRYLGQNGTWPRVSYQYAMTQPTNFFRDKIVFVGTQPKTSVADGEQDEFRTPYTRWTGETMGGVEIMLVSFLNLMNGDWLRRPAWWIEGFVLMLTGASLGGALCLLRRRTACILGATIVVVTTVASVSLSHFTNYWFPWLVIAGGQVPCALAWALAMPKVDVRENMLVRAFPELPDIPGYKLFNPPFGIGAYGKVWLARNPTGQWRAVKVVFLTNFDQNTGPYDREFNGVSRYKPISDKHPGFLRVDFVSEKRPEYFYYVMELGDSLEPGWERDPSKYRPRDLVSERARAEGRRLPVRECIRIGLELTNALDFLHRQGLTHRDIKPQNVIFVNGQPKLADLGLISEIRPLEQERTYVGTPGYMPPPPESPGTPHADIYALGMLLYVISTGRNPALFPELSTTIVAGTNSSPPDFIPLNGVILNACQPDWKHRYDSAAEMHNALREVMKLVDKGTMNPTRG